MPSLYVELKKKKIQMNSQNRKLLIDLEKELMVARWGVEG